MATQNKTIGSFGLIMLSIFSAMGIISIISFATAPHQFAINMPEWLNHGSNEITLVYGQSFPIILTSTYSDTLSLQFISDNQSAYNLILGAKSTFFEYDPIWKNNSYALPVGNYTMKAEDYDTQQFVTFRIHVIPASVFISIHPVYPNDFNTTGYWNQPPQLFNDSIPQYNSLNISQKIGNCRVVGGNLTELIGYLNCTPD